MKGYSLCRNEEENYGTCCSGLKFEEAKLASWTAVFTQSNISQCFRADAERGIFPLAYRLRIGWAWSFLPGGEWVYTIFISTSFYCHVVDTQCYDGFRRTTQ